MQRNAADGIVTKPSVLICFIELHMQQKPDEVKQDRGKGDSDGGHRTVRILKKRRKSELWRR